MKNTKYLAVPAVLTALVACGPSQEEIDRMNKKIQDSLDSVMRVQEEEEINKMMAMNDSLDQARADSIQKAVLDSTRRADSLARVKGKKPLKKEAPKL